MAKNVFRKYCMTLFISFSKELKNLARKYYVKKLDNEKVISQEFKRIKEKFYNSNRIHNEISIHLISECCILNKTSSILDRSINTSINGIFLGLHRFIDVRKKAQNKENH